MSSALSRIVPRRDREPATRTGGRARRPLAALAAGGLAILLLDPAQAAQAPDSFAPLAEKVTPAVVNVSTQRQIAGESAQPRSLPFNFPEGSPFEEFFRQFGERQGRPSPERSAMALGSGFIIDPAGYVVTNNHVVESATNIDVTLTNGKSYPAKLLGADAKTDLALLKIDSPDPLPAVSFGDSDALKVGDWVMAVGNPFGLGGTVTAGILSARGRDLHAGPFDDFLQIDASINQGNSGGPTFAMNGEVIGINTAIASPNGGSVGIGFAVPSNIAKPVIAALREHGEVERGWLGVQIQEVTPEIADAVGLKQPKGAIVSSVLPDSPAAKAGLRRGDIIVAFDDKPINELRDLPRLVAEASIGGNADVTVWRDHDERTVSVRIAKLQDEDVVASDKTPAEPGVQPVEALGLTLAGLTPDLRQQMGIPDDIDGVVVMAVEDRSPAAEQGLRPGDVIRQVGSESVTRPQQVESLAQAARAENRQALLLLVNRGGNELFVALKVAA
ncbi:MAG: DegQ family serine endoprotease [Dongiaceae bacterium]